MKKFYSFLLASLAVATTTYAAPQVKLAQSLEKVSNEKFQIHKLDAKSQVEKAIKAPAKAVARAESDSYTWKLLGNGTSYLSTLSDMYPFDATEVNVVIYQAEGHEGIYKVTGVFPDLLDDSEIILDATDPNYVIVADQNTGYIDEVDGETHIASLNYVYEQEGYSKEEIIEYTSDYIITFKDGAFYIPEYSIQVQWPNAPADSKYGTDPEEWSFTGDDDGYIILPGGNYVSPWVKLDNAEFKENIVYGSMIGSENTAFSNVEAYYHSKKEGQYKVIDPLAALYAAGELTSVSPTLKIDASDPDNVFIDITSSGIGYYYYMSESAFNYYYGNGADATEDEYRVKLANDGTTTTITFPYHSMDILDYSTYKAYYGAAFESVLRFNTPAGVKNVTVATPEDGEATYYNLQGVRVANPENGLYIRVQNGKATKQVIK